MGQGFEGLNIFDISDPTNPILVKNLRMAADTTPTGCGSHTATLVPDVANGNLYVYNSASSGACPGIDIVRIPLSDPENAEFLHRVPTGRSCHHTGVILGDAMLAACAGGNGFTVLSLSPDDGGSNENPVASTRRPLRACPSDTPPRSPGTARCSSSATSAATVPRRSARRRAASPTGRCSSWTLAAATRYTDNVRPGQRAYLRGGGFGVLC